MAQCEIDPQGYTDMHGEIIGAHIKYCWLQQDNIYYNYYNDTLLIQISAHMRMPSLIT